MRTLLYIFTIIAILAGGALVYANTAYFPLRAGVVLEGKVLNLEHNTNSKLTKILTILENNYEV